MTTTTAPNNNNDQVEVTPETILNYLLHEGEVEVSKIISVLLLNNVLKDLKEFATTPEKNKNDGYEIAFAIRLSECVRAGFTALDNRISKENIEKENETIKKLITHPCMEEVLNNPDEALKFVLKLVDQTEDYLIGTYKSGEEMIEKKEVEMKDGLNVLMTLSMDINSLAVARIQTKRAINLLEDHFSD